MNTLASVFGELTQITSRYTTLSSIKSKADNSEWINLKFTTSSIRYGHLEYFKANNDKVEVVHSTCYPQFNVPLPIFGFDIIALNKKITGIFCDVTPSPHDHPILRSIISTYYNSNKGLIRVLPEWAGFFSPQFLAISPEENNWRNISQQCENLFEKYLIYSDRIVERLDKKTSQLHKDGQNTYSKQQQKNTKTMKALSAYIGEVAAKEFVEKVLFPITK